MTDFRLLGPIDLTVGGVGLEIGPPQRQAVLAALAVDAGRHVSIQTLVERVWDIDPPSGARRAVQAHISRLRRLLAGNTGDSQLQRLSRGYLLQVDPSRVDLHRFRGLVERGRQPHRPDPERAADLRAALELWRGEPLAGLNGSWAESIRETWRRHRVDAALALAELDLRAGQDPNLTIGRLSELAREQPLLETLAAALIRTLHASGRTPEALRHYALTRQRLVEELGIEPHTELRQAHREVLDDAPVRKLVPAQLPMDVVDFTGRRKLLEQLDRFGAAATESTAVRVTTLSGPAGVGKSALALHWAHRMRASYPDGQLYVTLRDQTPAAALSVLLLSLGVPAGQAPDGVEAAAALYRTLLAGKRLLIVLDDARDAEQVAPLLPGTAGCLVLVTSRGPLPELTARYGARPLSVGPLAPDEACRLLSRLLGRHPSVPETRLLATSRRLPRALRTAAVKLLD